MTFVVFFVILSVLILVHELGHFLSARKFGVKVEEFGFGLPPKVKTIAKRGETEYTLNLLPLGGFVRLLGEDRQKILNPLLRKRALFSKSYVQRFVVIVAGVMANFALGVVLFSIVYSVSGIPKVVGERVLVSQVSEGSPADLAGIEAGDVFVSVESREVSSLDGFVKDVGERRGEMVTFEVGSLQPDGKLADEVVQIEMTPRAEEVENEGALGVTIMAVAEVIYEKKPWYLAPFYGVVDGVKEAYYWGRELVTLVVGMFVGLLSGRVPKDIAGPVGIFKMTGEVQKAGIMALFRFAAILSINLGVFNLLPIPALDGGRLVFLFLEKLFGGKRIGRIERWAHGVGFVVLIVMLVLITIRDVGLWK